MAPSHTLFAAVALSSSFPQHHCASVTDRFSATGYRSNGQDRTPALNQGKESRSNAQRKFHRVQASPTAFTQSFLPPHPTAQTVDIRLDTSYAGMISRPTTPILNQSGSGSLATPRSSTEQLRSSRQSITIEEPERPRTAASHSSLHSGTGTGTSSPARSGVVGDGMYGGRRGGPSLNKSRTSSSGGLSDVKAGYERRVSFDTMPDADETNSGAFSFTLQVKSRGFLRTKNTRTFMVAVDDNPYSERALEWLMENLVEDGDEVVAVRILDEEAYQIDQEDAREEARELMASIVELNEEAEDRKISIVVEFVAGKVVFTILNIIHVYRPDSLTVGTRGKSANKFQKMLGQHIMGHVSRDILTSSPVPVVVVRPEAKVQKHLKKRLNDPKRRGYHNLVKGVEGLPMSITKNKRRSLQVPS